MRPVTKIEVFGSGSEWYWHIVASNGRITADAEKFVSKANAKRAATAFVRSVFHGDKRDLQPAVRFLTMVDNREGVALTLTWYQPHV